MCRWSPADLATILWMSDEELVWREHTLRLDLRNPMMEMRDRLVDGDPNADALALFLGGWLDRETRGNRN